MRKLKIVCMIIFFACVSVVMMNKYTNAGGVIKHTGFAVDSPVQSYVQYAYDISGGDMDFITTLEAENGLRNPNRRSEVIDKRTGTYEDSWGFCQLHRNRHADIVDDKRFFKDPYRQLDQCLLKYNGGTKFYGYYVRYGLENRFTFNGEIVGKLQTKQEKKPEYIQQGNPYTIASQLREERKQLSKQLNKKRKEEIKAWKICKDDGLCNE